MAAYLLRRLILLPITLFCIVFVNFIIINLAPGEPTSVIEVSQGQESRQASRSEAFGGDERYLQFREHFGLTLPIVFNMWPWISQQEVRSTLWTLVHHRSSPQDAQEMPLSEYDPIRITFGDQSRFIMPDLVAEMEDSTLGWPMRRMAMHFFIRGGTQQAYVGPNLSEKEKQINRRISKDNDRLRELTPDPNDSVEILQQKIQGIHEWYEAHKEMYEYTPTFWQKVRIFFFETRVCRYFSRVLTLDFGTLRDDSNKTVIQEVTRRFKYSLTLAILPMCITFVLCQVLGFAMALKQNQWMDHTLNFFCLVLYAIPVFVVAPFLIENFALNKDFPFTHIPIPYSGFTSPDAEYLQMTSSQRLFDVIEHIFLPIVAIIYGSLAAQARLSRTAILEVLRQDYVRTARAKGVSFFNVMLKHVGRNSAITIVTSIAGSLGIVLGGSLIVETIFEINGFGKFFYEAVVNRDYNVMMFSALAGSFLTLIGYLIADIAYTLLDPRITLE